MCEKCIHKAVCYKYPFPDTNCRDYLSKNKVFIFPAKVGDIVYWEDVKEDKFETAITEVGSKGFWVSGMDDKESMEYFYPWDNLGENIQLKK